jgi:hypothetical protein
VHVGTGADHGDYEFRMPVSLPPAWAAPGHVLTEPWFRPEVRSVIAGLMADVEAAAPQGLESMRRRFRDIGRAADQASAMSSALDARAELLVASRLARAGALKKIRMDTPDFDCELGGAEFGVEVTTRAREEAAAMERELERQLWDDDDVHVMLSRTGKLLFSESPAITAAAGARVAGEIRAGIAVAPDGQYKHGNVPVPELGLAASWTTGIGMTFPGGRVAYQSVLTFSAEEWEHHWNMAALQVKDSVEGKGRKRYDSPSIAVVDVSRLGETSRLLTPEAIAKYQEILDSCELGNLRGAMLIRTTLDSPLVQPIAHRLDDSVRLGGAAVVLGEFAKPLAG